MKASSNSITGEDNTRPGSFWRSGAMINAGLFEVGEKHSPDFSSGIDRYKKPVLFLYSGQNKAYPDDWAHGLAGVFYSRQLVKIDGTGHDGIFSDAAAWSSQTLPRILNYIGSL